MTATLGAELTAEFNRMLFGTIRILPAARATTRYAPAITGFVNPVVSVGRLFGRAVSTRGQRVAVRIESPTAITTHINATVRPLEMEQART